MSRIDAGLAGLAAGSQQAGEVVERCRIGVHTQRIHVHRMMGKYMYICFICERRRRRMLWPDLDRRRWRRVVGPHDGKGLLNVLGEGAS